MSTVIINLDNPYTPRVWNPAKESNNSEQDSVFDQLCEVVKLMLDVANDPGADYRRGIPPKSLDETYERQSYGEYNNVVSIVGNRGTGKSSILRSVPFAFNSLSSTNDRNEIHDDIKTKLGLKDKKDDKNNKHQFITLPIFDPTIFKDNETLIEAFLAQLFNVYNQQINSRNYLSEENEDRRAQRMAVNEAFKKVKQSLTASRTKVEDLLKGDGYGTGDFEVLGSLAAGSSLLGKISNLVYTFLNWLLGIESTNISNNKMIVVCLDDLDLYIGDNIICILEDLRLLSQCPGILVVTAFRLEQVREEVQAYYVKKFKVLIKSKKSNPLSEDIEILATKYIVKQFPIQRRFYTKDILGDKSTEFELNQRKSKIIVSQDKNQPHKENLRKYLKYKFEYCFKIDIDIESFDKFPLKQNNFRQFIQFTAGLNSLEEVDVVINDDNIKINTQIVLRNFEWLKVNWFVGVVLEDVENWQLRKSIENIVLASYDSVNKIIVQELSELLPLFGFSESKEENYLFYFGFLTKDSELIEESYGILEFIEMLTRKEVISYGDIIVLLERLSKQDFYNSSSRIFCRIIKFYLDLVLSINIARDSNNSHFHRISGKYLVSVFRLVQEDENVLLSDISNYLPIELPELFEIENQENGASLNNEACFLKLLDISANHRQRSNQKIALIKNVHLLSPNNISNFNVSSFNKFIDIWDSVSLGFSDLAYRERLNQILSSKKFEHLEVASVLTTYSINILKKLSDELDKIEGYLRMLEESRIKRLEIRRRRIRERRLALRESQKFNSLAQELSDKIGSLTERVIKQESNADTLMDRIYRMLSAQDVSLRKYIDSFGLNRPELRFIPNGEFPLPQYVVDIIQKMLNTSSPVSERRLQVMGIDLEAVNYITSKYSFLVKVLNNRYRLVIGELRRYGDIIKDDTL